MPAIGQLGEYIRDQRQTAKISLRELAKSAGVSNPYLSQIERGLRKPSAEILQQIAKGLRISAEALYVQAGFLDQREASPVVDAILADESMTERQKQVLLEIHESFRRENVAEASAQLPSPVVIATTVTHVPVTDPLSTAVPTRTTPTPSTKRAVKRTTSDS
jgi:transcriptional regulator with XRE-family HTH domain